MRNQSYELPSVHMSEREKTAPGLLFRIPVRGEEAWLISVFFWRADYYSISIRKCAAYGAEVV